MNAIVPKIEALLFLATRPVDVKRLATSLSCSAEDVRSGLAELGAMRNAETSGVHVVINNDAAQLVTSPACADVSRAWGANEDDAELTKPSLEALTIIAYRGPVTKPEIETIRGVNCSLILRNLLVRGLIDERDDAVKMQPVYTLSFDALRFLGVHGVEELPDYGTLHANAKIEELLLSV